MSQPCGLQEVVLFSKGLGFITKLCSLGSLTNVTGMVRTAPSGMGARGWPSLGITSDTFPFKKYPRGLGQGQAHGSHSFIFIC